VGEGMFLCFSNASNRFTRVGVDVTVLSHSRRNLWIHDDSSRLVWLTLLKIIVIILF